VRRGDILVASEGEAITGVDDIARLLDDSRMGVSATLQHLRGGVPLTVSILPMEQ
jgi:S1-C subfamily serine protease